MPLPPSRRDILRPPKRDLASLASIVRHLTSYLHSLDPGILDGRWATPSMVPKGPPRQLVGGDAAGDDTDYAWEYDDRHTVTAPGTQITRLSHVPIDETLHVFWHPAGNGALRLTSEYFTVDDQIVTITDPGYFAVGDTFSFQYEYEVTDEVADLQFIASVRGVSHFPEGTVTFALPPETQPGDFLVVSVRGPGGAGGGDVATGVTTTDPRISRIFVAATYPVVESIFTGFANGSRADVVTDMTVVFGTTTPAAATMAVFRGVNEVVSVASTETGSATPQVAAAATVAVTWVGNITFVVLDADPPTGYTDAGDTGLAYTATDISYWSDPDADISIAGTFGGEGCVVIGLT